MTNIQKIIAELEGLAEKATPGDWEYSHDVYAGHYDISTDCQDCGSEAVAQVLYVDNEPGGRGEMDAALIVALKNHLPTILKDRERMREALAMIEAGHTCPSAIARQALKEPNNGQ